MALVILFSGGELSLPGGKAMAPIAAPIPVSTTIEPHINIIRFCGKPHTAMVPEEDITSGKFDKKTPIMIPNQIITAACEFALWPWTWPAVRGGL